METETPPCNADIEYSSYPQLKKKSPNGDGNAVDFLVLDMIISLG